MKPRSSAKLLGVGLIALTAAIALSQPAYAKKKPKVTVTTTPGSTTSGSTVVPVVPTAPGPGTAIAPAPGPGPSCAPGPVPCGPPPVPVPIAKDYFFCGQSPNGVPTTYVNTPSGNMPLVRWVSHFFNHSGYTPEVRCRDVSQRFNRFYNQGILNFITTGYINNLPVVCVATQIGGPCTATLFTLKPNQNATSTIQQLFDVRAGASGPLHESGDRIYIDMRPYTQAINANR
mgnify:CR=1 FL=1